LTLAEAGVRVLFADSARQHLPIKKGEAELRTVVSVGFALLALQSVAGWRVLAEPVRWSGNGHLYEVRHDPAGLSWPQALLRSQALGCGWYLVTITSKAENDFVFGLAAERPEVFDAAGGSGPWLGAFQKNALDEPAGNYRWVTEEPFAYANWNPGEPNNSGDEAFVNSHRRGTWNDAAGRYAVTVKGFIVEFDEARRAACRARG
jgi:hypothetical protein